MMELLGMMILILIMIWIVPEYEAYCYKKSKDALHAKSETKKIGGKK